MGTNYNKIETEKWLKPWYLFNDTQWFRNIVFLTVLKYSIFNVFYFRLLIVMSADTIHFLGNINISFDSQNTREQNVIMMEREWVGNACSLSNSSCVDWRNHVTRTTAIWRIEFFRINFFRNTPFLNFFRTKFFAVRADNWSINHVPTSQAVRNILISSSGLSDEFF